MKKKLSNLVKLDESFFLFFSIFHNSFNLYKRLNLTLKCPKKKTRTTDYNKKHNVRSKESTVALFSEQFHDSYSQKDN